MAPLRTRRRLISKYALLKAFGVGLLYAKKIASKVHTSFHFDLDHICGKGVPPEPAFSFLAFCLAAPSS